MNKRFPLIGLLLLSFFSHAEVTSVTATIDRNPVMLDEAITLSVVAEGDAARDAFNSSALLQDFVVGRTSVSSQTSIVNFTSKQTTTWTTTLFPRKVGKFVIPAIAIENQQSQPINVNVTPVQQGAGAPTRDYYVTAQISDDNVYLQQQLQYTVKLFLASQIERGSLQAPELENGQIQQIGEDKQYSQIINGKRYQVIERNFAVLPQQSGNFTISGPVFSGEVMAPNTNQRFGFFNRTKSISRVGPNTEIKVKPIPADVDYHWLPSEFVQLDEEWQTDTFIVGEPVTRTLTLTAVGVVEEQLPEITQVYPPDFKLYPDQANSASAERDNRIIVQRTESVAMIPTKPGSYILPEVVVPWFNVTTGKTEFAKLPSRTVTVAPAINSSVATPLPSQEAQSASVPPIEPAAELANPKASPASLPKAWDYGHVGLFALWVITLIALLVSLLGKRKGSTIAEINSTPTPAAPTVKEVVRIVNSENVPAIQSAITQWLNGFTASERRQLQQQIKPEIDKMMASTYSSQSAAWDKQGLLNVLSALNTPAAPTNLTPLYPNS